MAKKKPWHRRSGVILRSGILGSIPGNAFFGSPKVIDSGEDAPLSRRGRIIWQVTFLTVLALGFALLALAVRH